MNEIEIAERKPKVADIDFSQMDVESQVIIHVTFKANFEDHIIRIWPTTYLICQQTGKKIPVSFYDGITMYPYWTSVPEDETLRFTLIFKGLPKACRSFDFLEEISEPGGFSYKNIQRNNSDVYYISLN